jgi:hypothetical protein
VLDYLSQPVFRIHGVDWKIAKSLPGFPISYVWALSAERFTEEKSIASAPPQSPSFFGGYQSLSFGQNSPARPRIWSKHISPSDPGFLTPE